MPHTEAPKTPAPAVGGKTILITGASRGIGLGLARHWLSRGHAVIAAARNPDGARDLWELERDFTERLRLLTLDVESTASVQQAARELGDTTIDVLVNNAGVLPDSTAPLARLSETDLLKAHNVNTLGPVRVTQALMPHLTRAKAPIVAVISSLMGSIADNSSGRAYAYRMSKTAVNMFVKCLAVDHPQLTAVTLHPGWVQTDMGGERATLSVIDSVNGLARVIDALKADDSGKFLSYAGKELPW